MKTKWISSSEYVGLLGIISKIFRSRLELKASSDEIKELMQMEYRVGKLELENMELEQGKMVHESIVQEKDLTIEQLRMELQVQQRGLVLLMPNQM